MGMSDNMGTMLISVIGIANTLGRIVLGYISDKPWINRLYLYNVALAICGIGEISAVDLTPIKGDHVFFSDICLSNFCKDLTTQIIYCAVFGATSGAYVGLTSVVLVDLLTLDRLTSAFGLLMLFQGIASAIGPPIIGK